MPKVKERRSTKTVGNPPLLLALGDSIVWGQGLSTDDKFCSKAAKSLNFQLQNRAHSGATILAGSGPDDPITAPGYVSPPSGDASATGEIPRSKPTILEQAASYDGDPDAVRLILLDGGINDVGLNNLVDPFYSIDDLDQSIEQHCHREMTFLLKYIVAKFRACKIILTGYFPILSKDSAKDLIPLLLMFLRLPPVPQEFWRIGNTPIDLATEFWHESDRLLAQSVKEVNDPRVTFVKSGFVEQNALFAKHPLLREPIPDPFDHPQYPVYDKVFDPRGVACKKYPQDSESRLICPMASLGHPLEEGAQRYFDAIFPRLRSYWPDIVNM